MKPSNAQKYKEFWIISNAKGNRYSVKQSDIVLHRCSTYKKAVEFIDKIKGEQK